MAFEPVVIKLQEPLMFGAEQVKELTFPRPMVAGDLRGISVRDILHDDIQELASRLSGIPTPIIKEMGMADYLEVSAVVKGFFGGSPQTGSKE